MNAISIDLRARYTECDPMGLVHHSVYPIWLEIARAELLRQTGVSYAELEREGVFIVVAKLELNYKKPIRYDDQVSVTATLERLTRVRIEHSYRVTREGIIACEARSILACVDREGRPRAVPDFMRQ